MTVHSEMCTESQLHTVLVYVGICVYSGILYALFSTCCFFFLLQSAVSSVYGNNYGLL